MENLLNQDSILEFLTGHVGTLRLSAFREDDRNNRRLLFDSDCVTSGDQNDFLPSSRAQPDSKLLAEMIFGSTPTVSSGESIKIHQFRNPMRMMFTKIFPAHQLTASGISSLQREQISHRRFSADPEYIGRIDSAVSIAIMPKHSQSAVLPQRVNSNGGSRRSSESSEEIEILPALHRLRRQKIGIAVLFTLGDESQSENERIISRRVKYLCSQSPTIFAAIKDELQDVVLTAYCARASVVEIMKRAWRRFLACMKSMCEATCRSHHTLSYFKLSWSYGPVDSAIYRFVETLSMLGVKYDTRQTNFFLSTLITSVLALGRSRYAGGMTRKMPDLIFKCADGRLLTQFVEIIGYFLRFVISDFDRVSVKAVPIPLMRSLSSRSTSKTSGALASLWSMVRNRRSVRRENSTSDKSANSSPSRRRPSATNGFLASSPSSPTATRDVPVIMVKENGLEEDEEGEQNEKASTLERRSRSELDDHTFGSVSSSVHSSSSVTNFASSAGGSSEEDDLLTAFFDDVEEIPISRCNGGSTTYGGVTSDLLNSPDGDALKPICHDEWEQFHQFADEDSASGRSLDVAISFSKFVAGNNSVETSQEVLIADGTTWKVFNTSNDETSYQSNGDTWNVCFPSVSITELLENVRMFGSQGFDANFCLMYMEDSIKSLFSKAEALTRFIRDGNNSGEKGELRSEFCTKVMRCDMTDLAFLLK